MAIPLNPAQRQAVEHQCGPLLVLAGAGSGKTRVITHRIARLIERGVPPSAIVALTFTNKAAGEMRERISDMLSETAAATGGAAGARAGAQAARALTISTFHSFGLQVLTRERAVTGGAFTIFDQGDVMATIKQILRNVSSGKNYDASAILARISNAKNAFQMPEEMPDNGADEYDEIAKVVYPKYQSALRSFRAYDFDDLVCEVARIWSERDDVLSRWQERYQFILVDEYQDTNRAQFELLRLLAAKHKNLCVVGDDDQSIYAWRGADVRNILEFEEHFPGATVVKLEQNYRSHAPILDVANAVIAKRSDAKYRKVLFTERAGGEKVRVVVAQTPEAEARFVAREIKRHLRDERRKPRQMAVLYRSNGQAKLIEEALREEQIPHKVVGGQQFFERKEVKDLLSYMKVVVNPHDEISLRRIINYPTRGIGEASVEKLALHALAKGWSLWQAVERVDALDEIPNAAREGCRTLEKIVEEAKRALEVEKRKPSDVVKLLCERTKIREDIDVGSGSPQAAARRWSNVEGLIRTFARRELRESDKGKDAGEVEGLRAFLQALTLDFGNDDDGPIDVVTLSTLHASKGLEFDVVFLIGCEEGLLPHMRTLETKATDAVSQDVEEERRLFYVGVTRARQVLYLSRAKHRMTRGKPAPRTPSRFVLELPPELVVEQEVKDLGTMSTDAMAAQAEALLAALDALK
jgi:DNA helicase-2/ATP-dependent DNA helicase PcrA